MQEAEDISTIHSVLLASKEPEKALYMEKKEVGRLPAKHNYLSQLKRSQSQKATLDDRVSYADSINQSYPWEAHCIANINIE
jgi:hypothetical protein